MRYTYNTYWQKRINETLMTALDAHPRVLMLRVDLRTPNNQNSIDSAVISRFIDSLKAKIHACQQRKIKEGKRVHSTSLRYIWAREFGNANGRKHYHLVLLLNRDTWCSAGSFQSNTSLAGLIKQAWCSALHVNFDSYSTLAHFPTNPALWIDRENWYQIEQGLNRANYLAKDYTKVIGDGERNFGCSQN